jgi:hypothetical protein
MRIRRGGLLITLGAIVVVGGLLAYPRLESKAVAQLPPKVGVIRPQLTRLQVDLFELRCGPDQLMKLDMMAVGQGEKGPMKASAEQVLQRLRQLGEAKLAIRYDSFVDLASETVLTTGKSTPQVNDVAVNDSGVIVRGIGYRELGFVVQLRGVWQDGTDPNLADVEFTLESSDTMDKTSLGMVPNANLSLPVFGQFRNRQHLVIRQGLPVLLACNNLGKLADPEKAPVLVARVVATRLIE